jgi:hypothetical protein
MSHPTPSPDDRPTGRPTGSGRRWGRILIPLGIVLVVAALIVYMLVVSQRGTGDDSEIYQQENGSAPISVLMGAPPA